MKILLTGEPGIGKSTVVAKVAACFVDNANGILAKEIRGEDGQRVGFEAANLAGEAKLLSHRSLIKSDKVVGNKYHVDTKVIDNFIVPELQKGLSSGRLIIMDEIGRMQSLSKSFLTIVDELLAAKGDFLGTIVLDPEPWSIHFKKHPSVILVNVVIENRDHLSGLLIDIFKHTEQILQLSSEQQKLVYKLLSTYFAENQFIQVGKLVNNAVPYILSKRVKKEFDLNGVSEGFKIKGNNSEHLVTVTDMKWFKCDCNLFRGEGRYMGKFGECSHIQAVKLFSVFEK